MPAMDIVLSAAESLHPLCEILMNPLILRKLRMKR